MPYIPVSRARLITGDTALISNKGELNYMFTLYMIRYLNDKGLNYQNISDVIAAAQDAADEMKRRVLSKYENKKLSDTDNIDPYEDLNYESK